jgi:dynein heavy chain
MPLPAVLFDERARWTLMPFDSTQDPTLLEDHEFVDPVMTLCEELRTQAKELDASSKKIQSFQQVFGQQVERYPVLDEVVSDIGLKAGMWEARKEVTTVTESWKDVLIMEMPVKDWEAQVQKWFKIASRAERELPTNPVAPKLREMSTVWKDLVPACGDLKNPSLQERHWEKLESVVGFKLDRDPDTWDKPFTLGSLLEKNIMNFREDIQRISTEATQEGVLEEMLGKVKGSWVNAEFTLANFKDAKDVFILAGVDEIQALLDDSMVTMGTILSSRFVAGIRPEVEKMETSLRSLQNVLDEWLNVQKNWMYLEPIFSAPDIQRQLPAEAKMFLDIDKGLKNIMKKVSENPNCMRTGTATGQAEQFAGWNDILEKIQKQLEDYLEFKRMAFPRFYFLSNDELLEVSTQPSLKIPEFLSSPCRAAPQRCRRENA